MSTPLNRVKMTVASAPLLGAIEVDTALPGFLSIVGSGGVDGGTYTYLAVDGNNWELGPGVYDTGTNTISRCADSDPAFASSSGASVSLGAGTIVSVIQSAYDIANPPGSGNAFVELAASTPLGASGSVLSLASLPQTYRDIVLVIYGTVSGNTNIVCRFNGDSGNNYKSNIWDRFGNSNQDNVNLLYLGVCSNTTNLGTNLFPLKAEIFNYTDTGNYKGVLSDSFGSGGGNNFRNVGGGLWKSNAAITDIDVYAQDGSNWVAGSYMVAFGRGVL